MSARVAMHGWASCTQDRKALANTDHGMNVDRGHHFEVRISAPCGVLAGHPFVLEGGLRTPFVYIAFSSRKLGLRTLLVVQAVNSNRTCGRTASVSGFSMRKSASICPFTAVRVFWLANTKRQDQLLHCAIVDTPFSLKCFTYEDIRCCTDESPYLSVARTLIAPCVAVKYIINSSPGRGATSVGSAAIMAAWLRGKASSYTSRVRGEGSWMTLLFFLDRLDADSEALEGYRIGLHFHLISGSGLGSLGGRCGGTCFVKAVQACCSGDNLHRRRGILDPVGRDGNPQRIADIPGLPIMPLYGVDVDSDHHKNSSRLLWSAPYCQP
ncbi:hypothetical protein Tco_1524742 [Tanacetum coccineum]